MTGLTDNYPSFFKSFLKGLIPSFLLLILFCAIALFYGNTYQQNLIRKSPSVTVSVEHSGQAQIETESKDQTQTEYAAHEDETHDAVVPDIPIYEPSLVENSQFGLLPKKDETSNLTPFEAYKRHFILPSGQKKFQLILGPIGFSKDQAIKISLNMPQDVSILLSPYAKDINDIMRIFKESGHEVWLEQPLETVDAKAEDTGPLSLRADFSVNKNMSVYKSVLGRTAGYAGLFLTSAGETSLTLSSARMQQLQKDIFTRGLGIAYLATAEIPSLHHVATEKAGHIRHLQVSTQKPFSLLKSKWEKQINENRPLKILYYPYPRDIAALSDWLLTLPERGYVLAPLSAE